MNANTSTPESNSVIVSGASRGIGQAIAERLVQDGWRVFNLDVIAPADSDTTTWIETDLADSASIKAAVAEVASQGPISGLVNNAGIPGDNDLLVSTTDDDLDRVYAINMRAPAILAREVSPSMKSQRFGRIVNISSRALLGKAYRTSYSGTKGAIASMTRVWALELSEAGRDAKNAANYRCHTRRSNWRRQRYRTRGVVLYGSTI